MSEAIVTKSFFGARDGEIHGTQFNVGDKVSGDLARVALKEGWAEHPKVTHKSPAAAADETSFSASGPAAQAGLDLASEQTARSSPSRRKGAAS